MKNLFTSMVFVIAVITGSMPAAGASDTMKPITGKPVIDSPELLEWPYDRGVLKPNLNDPTSNVLHDLHAGISSCELVFSSEGNYHPALKDIWPIFLAKFKDRPLQKLDLYYESSGGRCAARSSGGPVRESERHL